MYLECGIYLFRRRGSHEWRPTEVFRSDCGTLCAYITWQTMMFTTEKHQVYNAWSTSFTEIENFSGDWLLLQYSEPYPQLRKELKALCSEI